LIFLFIKLTSYSMVYVFLHFFQALGQIISSEHSILVTEQE